jgi:hypothetical protein
MELAAAEKDEGRKSGKDGKDGEDGEDGQGRADARIGLDDLLAEACAAERRHGGGCMGSE